MLNQRILVVSDLHAPYTHPDTVPFLQAVTKKYRPTRVVLTGDEADKHALSYHESDPDLDSAGTELEQAQTLLTQLYRCWPKADVLDSNHGSLAFRKAKTGGIPKAYLRAAGEVLGAPSGWRWHDELILRVPGGNEVLFHHGLSPSVMKVVAQRGMCVVQGHYHTKFEIGYLGNPNNLLWGMTVGCLIDGKSLAFAYNKLQLSRPIIGCGIILDGQPKLLPMVLNKSGRWTKEVP